MYKHLIELKGICKKFNTTDALNNINLYIDQNEFLTLLGPSGCGKSTLLRIIAGFETPTGGSVTFEGEDLLCIPPHKRKINTVFQKYALFTHMNVYDNIAFGLKIKKMSKDKIDQKVKKVLKLVNLEGFEDRDIDSLSGGQQQRIAIARAIVNEPAVLLLDEPLAALDLKLRKDMQLELKNMQRELGITFIYVTHDQEEALSMSDTVVVMKEGTIQQIGTPTDIYNEPKNAYVADFIGESNIVPGIMKKDCLVNFCGEDFECVDTGFDENESVDVVIRPEDFYVVDEVNAKIKGVVESVTFKGVHNEIIIDANNTKWMVQDTMSFEVGQRVGLIIKPFDIHIMKKEADK
ncbi:MAG: ABC transporter ATP-binding protein [Ruminococcaceae bacterium]|nr:ABC transporter ATP-binding protein [Oscillospiraceae bacterium]